MRRVVFLLTFSCALVSSAVPSRGTDQSDSEAAAARVKQLKTIYDERLALLARYEDLNKEATSVQSRAAIATAQYKRLDAQARSLRAQNTRVQALMTGQKDPVRLLQLQSEQRAISNELGTIQASGDQLQQEYQRLQKNFAEVSQKVGGLHTQAENLRAAWLNTADVYGTLSSQEHEAVIGLLGEWMTQDPKNTFPIIARGLAYQRLGDESRALADFTGAVKDGDPTDPIPLALRGKLLWFMGNKADGVRDLGLARARAKDSSLVYTCLGLVHAADGKFTQAHQDFRQATKVNPQDAAAARFLALLEATAPQTSVRNGKKAVEAGNKAVEITKGNEWATLDALAAAYAEAGDFALAAKNAEQASKHAHEEARLVCDAHAQQYKRKEPLRLDWKTVP